MNPIVLDQESRFSKHQLSVALLEIYQKENRSLNRYNAVGRGDQNGNLDHHLNTTLTPKERSLAYRALAELEDKGLIIATYTDMVSPEDWLTITDLGVRALKEGAIDEVDELLLSLNSPYDLINMRYGAHDAIASKNRDWQRHAATSCRELITKVLHTIAPDKKVQEDPHFVKDPSSSSGITRSERIRHYLRERNGRIPKRDFDVADEASNLIEACYGKLASTTHTDNKREVETLVKLTENALIFLLTNEYD